MATLIFIIISVSILILAHEWGHFYSARKLGVNVEEFGIGFPPRLWSRVKNGVRYSVNLFPFGGFVKIFGERGEGEGQHESFISRPVWQRFVILFAGVGMNLVLAWALFSIGSTFGIPSIDANPVSHHPVSVVGVSRGSPAEAAGLKFGDKIFELRSQDISLRVESEKDVLNFTDAYRGEPIMMIVQRGTDILTINAIPRVTAPDGEGPLGVGLARITLERTAWYRAPIEGSKIFARIFVATVNGFASIIKDLVTHGKTSANVSGPVGIYAFAENMRSLGISYFIQFVGILSVNLGILNLLPIPALDGGRILFLIIEKLRGARVNPHTENMAHTLGFLALILFMAFITYHDIARLI